MTNTRIQIKENSAQPRTCAALLPPDDNGRVMNVGMSRIFLFYFRVWIAWLLLLGSSTISLAADFREDFKSADPALWASAKNPQAAIVPAGDKPLLRLAGREMTTLKIPCESRQDFVLQMRVKGCGGVQFRDGYKIFFKPDGNVWIRRPGSMLLDWVRTPRNIDEFHTIKVVAIGKIVRFYADGLLELEMLDHAPVSGPFYLVGSGDFDWIEINEQVPADEALMAVPKDAGANFCDEEQFRNMKMTGPRVQDSALAFKAGEPVRIPVLLLNQSSEMQKLTARASFDDFTGKALVKSVEMMSSVSGGAQAELVLDFGAVPNGFHRLQLSLMRENKTVRTVPYPVFVGVPEKPTAFQDPVFPFGVILQTVIWKPIHTKTYWHGIASLLQANHLNTVANINCHREFPETFEKYGIATVERTENRLDYPSVIGLLPPTADPKQLSALQQATAKPVLATLSMEDLGRGTDKDPLKIWAALQPRIRVLRLSQFEPALPEALQRVNTGFDSPWWAMIPVSHRTAELRALTHLALVYGAKGVLYASLQGGADGGGLVNYLSLHPEDDKLAAIGELGRFVSASAAQLLSLRHGTHVLKCDNPEVLAIPVMVADQPAAYLVNVNTQASLSCTLSWEGLSKEAFLKDVYTGETIRPNQSGHLSVKLEAGGGKLLTIHKPAVD
jgi:hypothetical protein